MTESVHRYDPDSLAAVHRVIHERRDMRHFVPLPVDPQTLRRLLDAAHAAPSVGLSQPWRFIRITLPELRRQIHELVQQERARTAEALKERGEEFLRLKVDGVLECGELLVVALRDGTAGGEIFGRRTLPEMDVASAACAIQNLWLAARAEGLGLGWVSIFDPQALARLLGFPTDVRPLAVLCLGHVEKFYTAPMLVLEKWRNPRPLEELLHENGWPKTDE
ncbi:MAG TPA: 5,6-dimethylbenzimidazole synthase [Steroidobacteraceae bacterium]|jgi:5,6-dimethylbenzimidazole synthase|nr:5,6-dimethylbenzimidazole synthase [Steroidobacteraceae bacterium]